MASIIAFQAKTRKRRQSTWVQNSLLNMNGFYAEARYTPGDPIRVQLRQGDSEVLSESVIRSQPELDKVLSLSDLASGIRLYYQIRGTVRERWLWLWGAEWSDRQTELFELLQQRVADNLLREWVFEEEARVIYQDEDYLFSAATHCDWMTYPAFAAQLPNDWTSSFFMAVRNGKTAYRLWLKRQEQEAEARRQEALRNPPQPPAEDDEFDLEAFIVERTKRYEAAMAEFEQKGLLQEPVRLGSPVKAV